MFQGNEIQMRKADDIFQNAFYLTPLQGIHFCQCLDRTLNRVKDTARVAIYPIVVVFEFRLPSLPRPKSHACHHENGNDDRVQGMFES